MKRINRTTVELSPIERRAYDLFQTCLDCDYTPVAALDHVSDRYGSTVSLAFYAWLSFPS